MMTERSIDENIGKMIEIGSTGYLINSLYNRYRLHVQNNLLIKGDYFFNRYTIGLPCVNNCV